MTLPTVSADGKMHSYTYDGLGRLSGTSLNTTTPYTTALTYKTHPSTGSSSHVLASYRSGSTTTTYQVDANGNITQLSDGTYTYTYVYDDFNQLIRENNPLLNKSITYDYDLGGNLLAVKEYAYTTGTLVNPTSTVVYTYDDTWKDQLTSIEGYGLTYDANGNLLSYKTRSYSWQAGRQLAQITDTNLNAVYTYNESGIRTRKVVNGVITDVVLEGGKVILETTGSDTLHYSYDSRGQLVSFSLNGTPYFYTRNGQSDITGLIDASGVEVVKYTYDSWGKPISITDTSTTGVGAKNPYRYRGYRYDNESGLYYLQSRYYDPSIKRFISADSVIADVGGDIQGNNLYSYCFNNPVNMSDPSGHWPSWIGTLLISTAVVATVVSISIFLAPAVVPATSIYATTAIGGAIGFVGNVVKQVVFDNRSLDNMNVDELIRSTAAGAISGAFATISSPKTVQSLGNALIAGTNTAINGGSLSDIGLSAFIGLSAGYIGGPGGFDGFASSTSAQAPFISETLRNSSMMSFYASSTFKSGSVSFGLDFINGFAKTNLSAN